jgi:histidinol phosphatase-like enzyme
MSNRAIFLDRDGVINHEVGYLHHPADVCWVDGIVPLCLTNDPLLGVAVQFGSTPNRQFTYELIEKPGHRHSFNASATPAGK